MQEKGKSKNRIKENAWFQEIKNMLKKSKKKLLSPLLFNAEVKTLNSRMN